MIEYKHIEKIVYLIPARNFYDGLTDSKVARDYQDFIEFNLKPISRQGSEVTGLN